jgi:hypothetical protein
VARVTAAGFALACLLLSGAASAQSQADRDRALELFREGNQLFAAGDLHGAYEVYQEAWALHPSFDVACNLGRTEAELSLAVPAAEHLAYCLRTFATSTKQGLRDAERKFQELFDGVRSQVSGVRIISRPLVVEVFVDGASMGTGPFDGELFVGPGERKFVVRAKGYRERAIVINATAGGSETIDIRLEPEARAATPTPAAAASAAAAPAPSAEGAVSYRRPQGLEPRTIAVATGAGLTLIGVGVGVALLLDARSAADETDSLRTELGGACSSSSSQGACVSYRDSIEHEKTSRNGANIAFAAGGIVGAATLGLWLVLPERAAERVAGVRPWLAADSGGLSVTGSY